MLGNPYRVALWRHPAKRITYDESGEEMNSTRGEKKDGGFSLVELIVTITIMAVLVAVLAPAYLRYVEKSRKQKDDAAAEEIRHAAEIVVLSGEYRLNGIEVLVTYSDNGVVVTQGDTGNRLKTQLEGLFGKLDLIVPTSTARKGHVYTVSIVPTADVDGTPEIVGSWDDD